MLKGLECYIKSKSRDAHKQNENPDILYMINLEFRIKQASPRFGSLIYS